MDQALIPGSGLAPVLHRQFVAPNHFRPLPVLLELRNYFSQKDLSQDSRQPLHKGR